MFVLIIIDRIKTYREPGMVAHAHYPSTWEAEAERSQVPRTGQATE
jgi:hypothetical protein